MSINSTAQNWTTISRCKKKTKNTKQNTNIQHIVSSGSVQPNPSITSPSHRLNESDRRHGEQKSANNYQTCRSQNPITKATRRPGWHTGALAYYYKLTSDSRTAVPHKTGQAKWNRESSWWERKGECHVLCEPHCSKQNFTEFLLGNLWGK